MMAIAAKSIRRLGTSIPRNSPQLRPACHFEQSYCVGVSAHKGCIRPHDHRCLMVAVRFPAQRESVIGWWGVAPSRPRDPARPWGFGLDRVPPHCRRFRVAGPEWFSGFCLLAGSDRARNCSCGRSCRQGCGCCARSAARWRVRVRVRSGVSLRRWLLTMSPPISFTHPLPRSVGLVWG